MTLVETLIYITLLTMMLIFLMAVLYQIIEGGQQAKEVAALETEASFIMQKTGWALGNVQSIEQPPASSTASTLSVSKYAFSQNPLVIDMQSGTIRLSRAGGEAVPLSSSRVRATELVFTHLPAIGNAPAGVKVHFSLEIASSSRSLVPSTTLESTFYLRR